MAAIKSFTDISQSRKLAEFLSLEHADMIWVLTNPDLPMIKAIAYEDSDKNNKYYEILPAWSLSSLLGVLPFHLIVNNQRYAFSMHKGLNKDGETYVFKYNVFNTDICLYSTDYYNNPIDACVDMVEKLHELNLL